MQDNPFPALTHQGSLVGDNAALVYLGCKAQEKRFHIFWEIMPYQCVDTFVVEGNVQDFKKNGS